jgi:hypothetical protein
LATRHGIDTNFLRHWMQLARLIANANCSSVATLITCGNRANVGDL